MKFTILSLIFSSTLAQQCMKPMPHCAPNLESGKRMSATLYSKPNFKGEFKTVDVDGYYGCVDVDDAFPIKSFKSTPSTKISLHFGKKCVGDVLLDQQNGNTNVPDAQSCIGSMFIKYQDYGRC